MDQTDASAPNPPTNTINGDLSPNDTDPSKSGIQAICDAYGNPIDGTAGPYADTLGGSTGNDHIVGGDLSDDLGAMNLANSAGDDWLEGGAGSDYVWGGLGNDLLEGGTESDILVGGDGNDQLYGDAKIAAATAIAGGSAGAGSGQKGDWLAGNEGDDTLVGSTGNDVLSGGGGKDLLIAGAGDDYILGDSDYVPQSPWEADPSYTDITNHIDWYHSAPQTYDWTVTQQNDQYTFAPLYIGATEPADSDNDIVYAGSGDDHVWGGAGDDIVYGEDGSDTVVGEAGNDILFGGAGDDTLSGDGSYLDPARHGDDYLEGGDGNDTLDGGRGNDALVGGAGDDTLYGGEGANYLDGGDGRDTLNSGGPGSSLLGGKGNDTLDAIGGGNYLDGEDGNDTLTVAGGGDTLIGGAGDDNLSASGGGSYLDGGEGANTLIADGGGNTLIGGSGDETLSSGGGNSYLDAGEGNNMLIADGGGNTLVAGAGNDTLSSMGGSNYLDGGEGANTLIATEGGNTLVSGSGDDVLQGGGGGNYLDGGDGADYLVADGGNNTLFGGAGDDTLVAGGGGNYLDGGAGLDYYVFDAGFGENRIADSGSGGNVAQFNFGFDGSNLVLGIGSLKLSFGNGDVLHIDGFDPEDPLNTCAITTFSFTDRTFTLPELLALGAPPITGTEGNDILQGTGLNETITALGGDDIIMADAGSDTIHAGAGNDTVDAGSGDNSISGQAGDDLISAGRGNDYIDGGLGVDSMSGGAGNDYYLVDNSADVILENADSGNDTVVSDASYTLSDNIETLHLGAGSAIDGTGNAQDNTLYGNSSDNVLSGAAGNDTLIGQEGNDRLDGGTGADILDGGLGADTYVVDDAGDQVTESQAGRVYTDLWNRTYTLADIDTVESSISYTLGTNLENLTLTGTADIDGAGNAYDNILIGNDGANLLTAGAGMDTLNGGAGADVMTGGTGADTYYVDDANDQVIETDVGTTYAGYQWTWTSTGWRYVPYSYVQPDYERVYSSADFTLGANLEELTLTGTADIDGAGNELNNQITGNAGNNILSGGAGSDTLIGGGGADTLIGGAGDDSYNVSETDDVIVEDAGGGYDRVYSTADIVLSANIEELTLDGAVSGTGNDSDNIITGSSLDNLIDGAAGNDALDGRGGSDTIYGGEGDDTISGGWDEYTRDEDWNWSLTPNNDYLDGGAGNDNIDGGSGNDTIIGGTGDDVLFGGNDDGGEGDGPWQNDDVIEGGGGNDRIDGGSGADRLFGGADDDVIYGGDGWGEYYDPATDSFVAMSNDDYIEGGDGYDEIFGQEGNDTLLGGDGDDIVYGENGDDILAGGGGWDELYGGDGNDILHGSTVDEMPLRNAGPSTPGGVVISGAEDDGAIPLANIVGNATSYSLQGVIGDGPYADLATNSGWDHDFYKLTLSAGSNITVSTFTGFDAVIGLYDAAGNLLVENDDANGAGGSTNSLDSSFSFDVNVDGEYYVAITNYDSWLPADPFDGSVNGVPGQYLEGGSYTAAVNIAPIGSGGAVPVVSRGFDTLAGGAGDDIYMLDGTYERISSTELNECGDPIAVDFLDWQTDMIIEYAGEGYDIVVSSAGFELTDNVEELRLVFDPGMAAADPQRYADMLAYGQGGYGNDLDNVIIGNELNNWLDGGVGADTLDGGAGNDTYVIDQAGDVVIEQAGGGIDTVRSSFEYTLGGELENLTLLDGVMVGRGNAGDNVLNGSADYNELYGEEGDDTLIANGGGDELYGGAGNDRYVFRVGDGNVWIEDGSGIDTLYVGSDLTLADLAASRSGDDMVLTVTSTGDSVTVANWFAQGEGIGRIEFCDAPALARAEIESLFNAPPVAGNDAIDANEDAAQTVISFADLLANDTDPDAGDVLSLAGFDGVTVQGNTITQDANGDLVFQLVNDYQYLAEGQTETDSFTYTIADAAGETSTATVSVTITGANDAPAVATTIANTSTDEDIAFSYTVPADTFTDIDQGDVLSYTATVADGSALPAWLSFDAVTQTFSGTPSNWNVGDLGITVTATDMGGLSASSGFVLNVANVNDAPVVSMALADQSTLEDAAFSYTIPAGTFDDVDFIHGDSLAYTVSLADGSALPAWLAFDAVTQTFSGVPDNWDVGTLNVRVTATDQAGASVVTTFALEVVNVNDTPTAYADTGTAVEDGGAVTLDAATLLANDTDPDFIHGDSLSIAGVSQAASGAAVSLVNGNVQYDIGSLYQSLGQGQTATDTFSYTVTDTAGATSTAQVSMTITGVNDAPVTAADDATALQEDLTITASGNVLANDSDVDQGTVLTVANAGVYQGTYGTLTLNADGSYTYALDNASLGVQSLAQGQVVSETFDYLATDGIASTPSALTVTITGTNDVPVVAVDTAAVQEDLSITATGNVLTNDNDIDQGTVLSVANAGVFVGRYGTLTLNVDGSYEYALDNASLGVQSLAQGQVVSETFDYLATDGITTTPSTLTVNITGTNDAPVVVGDSNAVREDLSITATGNVLANDSDVDQGTVLSVANAGTYVGQFGILTLNADGSYTYALDNASLGVQSLAQGQVVTEVFDYQASDGITATPSILTVSITGTNDAPVVEVDAAALQEDLSITASGNVLANDSDVDQGTVLQVANAGIYVGQYGTLTLNADGSYSYALDNALLGVQSLAQGQVVTEVFDYQASDGITATPSILTVSITGTNDAPVVVTEIADRRTLEDEPFSYTLPADTFADIDQGDVLGYSAKLADGSALPDWLKFDAATLTFSGVPSNWDVAKLDIAVTATDKVGATATSVFQLDVQNVNDAPIVPSHLSDQHLDKGKRFSFTVPADTFDDWDIVHGDSITLSAALADGEELPKWLSFDAATRTFSGKYCGSEELDILLTATDQAGATVSQAFRIDTEQGRHDDHHDDHHGDDHDDHHGQCHDETPADTRQDEIYTSSVERDIIRTGDGADTLVYLRGDGRDTLYGGIGTDNTLVLAGGITEADIALTRQGNDLILETGSAATGDQITLRNWYDTGANYKSVLDLVVMNDAIESFGCHGERHDGRDKHDEHESSLAHYDFSAVVNAFDQACGASANLQHWNATQSLMVARLAADEDDALGSEAFDGVNVATLLGLGSNVNRSPLNPERTQEHAQLNRQVVGV